MASLYLIFDDENTKGELKMSHPTLGEVKIPLVGLGTWQATDEAELSTAIDNALEIGYRHIDTAAIYANEHIIGKVLEKWFKSGRLNREDIFITTKLSMYNNEPDLVEPSLRESLEKLKLDYVDLYLVHFPIYMKKGEHGQPNETKPTDQVGIWKKMEEQIDAKRAKTIGVSNFNIEQIERILKNCRIKPVNNQIEVQIYHQQKKLREFCSRNNITVVSFATLGSPGAQQFLKKLGREGFNSPNILFDPVVIKLAEKYKKTTAQIVLRYFTQQDVVVIPKSVNPERLKENFNIFNFTLDDEDCRILGNLDRGEDGIIFFWTHFAPMIVHHPEFPYKNTKRWSKLSNA